DVARRGQLIDAAFVAIALQRERLRRARPVGAKAGLRALRAVADRASGFEVAVIAKEVLAIDAIEAAVAQDTAVARAAAALAIAAARRDQRSGRVPGVASDDVDDAVHRVGAPQRRAGTADDF